MAFTFIELWRPALLCLILVSLPCGSSDTICTKDSLEEPVFYVTGSILNNTVECYSYCVTGQSLTSFFSENSYCICLLNTTVTVLEYVDECVNVSSVSAFATTSQAAADENENGFLEFQGFSLTNGTMVASAMVSEDVQMNMQTNYSELIVQWGEGGSYEWKNTTSVISLEQFRFPGYYDVTVYPFKNQPDYLTERIGIQDSPKMTVIRCDSLLEVGTTGSCDIVMDNAGMDFAFSFIITPPLSSIYTDAYVPSVFSKLRGFYPAVATIVSYDVLAVDNLAIIGRMEKSIGGTISKLHVAGFPPYAFELYILYPKCSNALVYCGISGGCSVDSHCSTDNALARSFSSLQYYEDYENTSSGNTVYTTRFIAQIASVLAEEIIDVVPMYIPYGSYYAIGCLSDVNLCSATVTLKAVEDNRMHADRIAVYDHTTQLSEITNNYTGHRYMVQIYEESSFKGDLTVTFNCSLTTPYESPQIVSEVAGFDTYLNMSTVNATIQMIGPFSEVVNVTEKLISCQERISGLFWKSDIWIPFQQYNLFDLAVEKGSPIYIEVFVETTIYGYSKEATNFSVQLNYSTPGTKSLTGNVTNLLNFEEFSAVIHIIPPVNNQTVATVSCPCFDIPEGFNLTLDLPAIDYQPWNFTVGIAFENGSSFLDDLCFIGTEVSPVELTAASCVIHASLLTKGSYNISLNMSNEVSTYTAHTLVEIEEGLRDVSADIIWILEDIEKKGMGINGTTYMTNKTVVIRPKARTGIPDYWSVYIHEIDVLLTTASENENITYVFTQNNKYTITVSGFNVVQKFVDSDPIFIETVSQIRNFDILDDGQIRKPNYSFPLIASFEIVPPISCLILDWGDDTPVQSYGYEELCKTNYSSAKYNPYALEFQQIIEHIYVEEGIYVIKGLAFDSQDTHQDFLEIIVADLPCSMPLVWVASNHTLEVPLIRWKSDEFQIPGAAAFSCNKTVDVSRFWAATQLDEEAFIPIKDITMKEALPTWDSSSLLITSGFLDVGLYKIVYSFSIHASKIFALTRTGYTYVKIIASPLVARLMDGGISSVSRGYGQIVELYPWQLSYDPDDPTDVDSLNVTLFCRHITEEDHQQSGGRYLIHNLQTIAKPGWALTATGGGCFGIGPGTLDVPEKQPLVINTASFNQNNATYEITLQLEKDARVSFSHFELVITPASPPSVAFKCVSEELCWYYQGILVINPSSRLAVRGECLSDCSSNDTFKWDIKTDQKLPANEAEMDCSSLSDPSACVPTFRNGKNKIDFIISEHFFKQNPDIPAYVLRLTITNPDGISGFAEGFILINKRPVNGKCELLVINGVALVEKYSAKCIGWEDPENIGIVSFTFYIVFYSENGLEKTALTFSLVPNVELTFPYGEFIVICEVKDLWGAFTEYIIGNVTLRMPTKNETDSFNPEELLQYLIALGDQNQLPMILIAIASIRDNADWLSLDFSNLNMTEEEINNRLIELTNIRKGGLSTAKNSFNFLSISELNVGSSVFKSSLKGGESDLISALTVDMESRDLSVELFEKLTNTMKNVKIDSPLALTTFLSNSLSAVGSIFGSLDKLIHNTEKASPSDLKSAVDWDYDTSVPEDIYAEVPLTMDEKIKQNVLETTVAKAKTQSDRLLSAFKVISKEILKRFVPGETIKSTSDNGATFLVSKMTEEVLVKGLEIESEMFTQKAFIHFPENFCPSRYNTPDTDCRQDIGLTASIWPTYVHSYSTNRHVVSRKTSVISVDVAIRDERVEVNNEKIPIKLVIPRTHDEVPEPITVNNVSSINDILPYCYHQVNVTSPMSAITIEIKPMNSSMKNIILFIDYQHMPVPSKFEKYFIFTNNNNRMFSVFINSDEINNRTGTFIVAVALLKNALVESESKTKFSKDEFVEDFVPNYSFRAFTSGCYYFNEMDNMWYGKGLRAVSVDYNKTICEAHHLTSFGSGFFPAPNAIDFEFVFSHSGFIDNITLYLVLIITLSCYVIMAIWARYMDKADLIKRGVIPLNDNKFEDKYLYEISFHTGPNSEAATESQISFIVSGKYGETDVRKLPKSKVLFRRYQINSFVMSTPGPLGDIFYLRVFHDNSGCAPRDSWQLQMVVIRDLQTRLKYVFSVQTWLAFNRDDGSIDKTFIPNVVESNFSSEMFVNINNNINQDNMWLSMFLRPVGSRFSRVERVTVAAVFWFLSMIINAVWYQTSLESPRRGYFDIGPFNMDNEQIAIGVVSLIIVFPIVIILIVVFKRARPKALKKCRSVEAIENQRKEQLMTYVENSENACVMSLVLAQSPRQKALPKDIPYIRCFPWWTRVIAWAVSVICIIASSFFVWSYGITWGENKTVKWFSAFIISFTFSLVFTEWIKVLLFALIASITCKPDFSTQDIDCDEELPDLKIDEEWNFVFPFNEEERKVHKIEGVDPDDPYVANLRNMLTKEREMAFVIRGILGYCLFLVILYTMINSRTDFSTFLLQEHLKATFVKFGIEEDDFSQIASTTDLWIWIKKVILQELLCQRHYNDAPPYGLRGFLNDKTNRAMGYGIIRQVRTNRHSCFTVSPINGIIYSCTGSRGIDVEETTNFCAGWKKNSTFKNSCRYKEFHYRTDGQLKTYTVTGKLGNYGGGGFVFELRGPPKSITRKMEELQKLQWIDQYTRAIFFEFSVYNANVNLFATCQLTAEFIEGGGILPQWRFEPVRLLPDSGIKGIVALICEFAFVIATIFFTLREIWLMKKMKCEYFYSYWNIAEICIISISYCAMYLYVYKKILINKALDEFNATYGNGYVRIDSAVFMDLLYLYAISFIVFFSTLKLIKLLQFNKRMDVLAQTIRLCWDDLSIFFMAFAIVFIAFVTLFFYVFKNQLMDFSEFARSLTTCFLMMIGKFDAQAMIAANPMSPFLFFIFALINSFILISIMLTIILVAFNEVQKDLLNKENKYDIIDFVWFKFRVFMRKVAAPNRAVIPSMQNKAIEKHSTEELSEKVNVLLKHVNDIYFDGEFDFSNPKILHKFTQNQNCPTKQRKNIYLSQ